MRQVWEALVDLESGLLLLQHRLGKCQQMFEMAQVRTQTFQNSLSLIEVLNLYDDGIYFFTDKAAHL
jgi:hypothetical protein